MASTSIRPSTADGPRLKNVTDFVLNKFLPKVKALARCEAGPKCGNPDADSMTFVDAHQAAFAEHGVCVRADSDPEFDRECFSPEGNSFESDPVASATSPLACSLRPSDFKPYAPARPLDPHCERQLFHGDGFSAWPAGDDAAQQYSRRKLGGHVGGLWRRVSSERRRPGGHG